MGCTMSTYLPNSNLIIASHFGISILIGGIKKKNAVNYMCHTVISDLYVVKFFL